MNATRLALCTLIAATLCGPAGAAATWTGGGANNRWATPENWELNYVPSRLEDAEFPANAAQFSIQVTNIPNHCAACVRTLYFEPGASGYDINIASTYLDIRDRLLMEGGPLAVNKVSGGGTVSFQNEYELDRMGIYVVRGRLDMRGNELIANIFYTSNYWVELWAGQQDAVLNLPELRGLPTRWELEGNGLIHCANVQHDTESPFQVIGAVTVVAGALCEFQGAGAWTTSAESTLVFESGSMTLGPLNVAGTLWMRRGSDGATSNTEVPSLALQPGAVFRFEVAADGTHNALSTGTTPNQLAGAQLEVLNDDVGSGHSYSVLRGAVPVNGTFAGLPEGAVFADAQGRNYSITYQGGANGMDVVITEISLFKDGFE
jgi:hypothetical protein